MEEKVDGPAAHEVGCECARGGPEHGRGPAGAIVERELATLLGELACRDDRCVAYEEQRLKIACAERLHQLMRGDEFPIDLRQRNLRVDVCLSAEQLIVERQKPL